MSASVVPTETLTVNDLVKRSNDAMDRLSNTHPNKILIYQLASALVTLSDLYTGLKDERDHLIKRVHELTTTPDPQIQAGGNDAITEGA